MSFKIVNQSFWKTTCLRSAIIVFFVISRMKLDANDLCSASSLNVNKNNL